MKRAENLFKRGLSLALSGVLAASLCLTVPPAAAAAGHVHNRACFLLCSEEHIHTEDCEFSGEPVCGLEEGEPHIHNEDGYFCVSAVICEPRPEESAAEPPAQAEPEPVPEPAPVPDPEPEPLPEAPEDTEESVEPEPAPEPSEEETPGAEDETAIDDAEVPASEFPPHECPEGYWDVEYDRCCYAGAEAFADEEKDEAAKLWEEFKAAVQAGGEITLTGNVEVREPLTVTGNTVIDLCGYELKYVGEEKGDGTYMLLADGSGTSLTVTDSGDGGTILNDVSAMESLLRVTNNATLNIDGGTLVNTLGQRAVSALSGGRVNMTGGVLTGVQAGSSGAGILVVNAALNMTGGKITGNSCINNGGAIRMIRSTVTIVGSAEISNNTANSAGGGISAASGTLVVEGDAHIFNNRAGGSGGGINVEASVTAPAVVTVGGSAHINANTDASGNRANGNITGAVKIDTDSDCIVGGYTEGIDEDKTGLKEQIENAENGAVITLQDDYEYKANPIEIDKELTIDLKSQTIQYLGIKDCLFSVVKGGSLTIQGNGTITSTVPGLDSLIQVKDGGVLNIEGGTFTNTNGIRAVTASGGTVNMTGGKLTGAQHGANGAGILVLGGGKLQMTGGEISGNTSTTYGGGIRVNKGTAEISGGAVISGNTAKISGGGISLSDGELVIGGNAGISQNTAYSYGGGICSRDIASSTGVVPSGKIVIQGGKISGNHSTQGGGIYATDISMCGGEINGNSAEVLRYGEKCGGGGIYVVNGTDRDGLKLTGGTVSKNTSAHVGGGIFVDVKVNAEISGKEAMVYITENEAMGNHGFSGGGIFVEHPDGSNEKGNLYVYNALITNNQARYGGGVAGCGSSSVMIFSIEGVAIYDNIATEESSDREDYKHSKDLFCDGLGQVDSVMLGGIQAEWTGRTTKDGKEEITFNEGVKELDHFYLKANLSQEQEVQIEELAKVIIKDNTSADGGGGIGGNGYMRLGEKPAEPDEPDEPDNPTTAMGSLTVKKAWNDAGHEDSRPESVSVQLRQNGAAYGHAEALTEAGGWTHTWTNLPLADENGEAYVYRVEELSPGEGYTVSSSAAGGLRSCTNRGKSSIMRE